MSARRRRPRGASAAGFTLIEVMISSAILLIGISGVVLGLRSAQDTAAHQRLVTQAIHSAESVMEDLLLRNTGHNELETGTHGPRWFDSKGIETSSTSTFEVRWNVQGAVPFEGMKRVTVTARWQEGDRERSFSITTDRP
jgi:prepilin-type N-terminal cleavage/methylation domain-containing protein